MPSIIIDNLPYSRVIPLITYTASLSGGTDGLHSSSFARELRTSWEDDSQSWTLSRPCSQAHPIGLLPSLPLWWKAVWPPADMPSSTIVNHIM